jgi:beta-N-acetylhexosaminidase
MRQHDQGLLYRHGDRAVNASARIDRKRRKAAVQTDDHRLQLRTLILLGDLCARELTQPLRHGFQPSALAGLSPEIRARAAEEFGRAHGRSLAALGINLNFAPVLDLRLGTGRNLFDLNTLIEQRAIASDPVVVADIARAYVQGLEASGVEATVKHFPGLGRVRGDTHLFDASLDAPLADLEASDWRPFKEVLAGSKAALMIGHVSLTAIDPSRPASHSKPSSTAWSASD